MFLSKIYSAFLKSTLAESCDVNKYECKHKLATIPRLLSAGIRRKNWYFEESSAAELSRYSHLTQFDVCRNASVGPEPPWNLCFWLVLYFWNTSTSACHASSFTHRHTCLYTHPLSEAFGPHPCFSVRGCCQVRPQDRACCSGADLKDWVLLLSVHSSNAARESRSGSTCKHREPDFHVAS